MLKQGLQGVPTWQEWTIDQAIEGIGGRTAGVDPSIITAPDARKLDEKIKKKGGKGLKAITQNLVDQVWGKDRPSRPNRPVNILGLESAGKAWEEKVEELRKELDKRKATGFVINVLDEIAWLFNLRGDDIECNPVFYAYALVTLTTVTIYVDKSKLSESVIAHLNGVAIRPYDAIFDDLQQLTTHPETDSTKSSTKRKYLIGNQASWALAKALGDGDLVEEGRSPILDAKACKNTTEVDGMRACHIRDGAAISRFFAWLEDQLINKGTTMNEVEAADKLQQIREQGDKYHSLSFPTISSTGANAAVIHYKPTPEHCSNVDPAKIYLCDSGAQYYDGTTDTTRTLHFGEPTAQEIEAYTLVLKGNIALNNIVFPKGTSGFAIDSIARQFLWQNGLDYRHGTGHGVGSFLNVHEGPIGIGHRIQYADVPLSPGNVISNEPGYYEDGGFGIRIENVLVVKEIETKHKFGERPYLGFENVTMVPMCRKLIDKSLLTENEVKWLDSYHEEVLAKTQSLLQDDAVALRWLQRECKPL